MTRELTPEQNDAIAEVVLDMDERLAAEDAAAAAAQETAEPRPA
jgi:hypothetical protein